MTTTVNNSNESNVTVLINEFICTNVLPEDIDIINEDKGR